MPLPRRLANAVYVRIWACQFLELEKFRIREAVRIYQLNGKHVIS